MRLLLNSILALTVCWPLATLGQYAPNRVAGDSIASGLLRRLTNPKDTEYRVGIVNTAAEFGALISAQGALPAAQYIRGYSSDRDSNWNLSWTAREQLDSSADSLRFEVGRKNMGRRDCPALEAAVDRFYKILDDVLQSPVSLSRVPPERQLQSITVDGTSYIIQIWTGERILTIYPDRDIDKSLDEESGLLMRVIGSCSNGLANVIEEHSPW